MRRVVTSGRSFTPHQFALLLILVSFAASCSKSDSMPSTSPTSPVATGWTNPDRTMHPLLAADGSRTPMSARVAYLEPGPGSTITIFQNGNLCLTPGCVIMYKIDVCVDAGAPASNATISVLESADGVNPNNASTDSSQFSAAQLAGGTASTGVCPTTIDQTSILQFFYGTVRYLIIQGTAGQITGKWAFQTSYVQ